MDTIGERANFLWKYYYGDRSVIPIYDNTNVHILKKDNWNPIHKNFPGDIVSLKRGYMAEQIEANIENDAAKEMFEEYITSSQFKIKNSESIEYSTVEGISHRLCYHQGDQFKNKNIHGWEVAYDYKDNIFDPDKAFYFHTKKDVEGKTIEYCDVYDREYVTYYVKDSTGFIIRDDVEVNPQKHDFTQVPLIPIKNNSNNKGDFDSAIEEMNAYDALMTAITTELNSMANAILKIKGNVYTDQYADGTPVPLDIHIKDTQTIVLGEDEDGKYSGDAEFISRTLDDAVIENTKKTLTRNIYKDSGSVDLDELTSAERVYAIKAGQQRLETTAKTSENFLRAALNKEFQLWIEWIKEFHNITVSLNEIKLIFKRVYPLDEQAQAEIAMKLSSIMAPIDAFKLAGFENPEEIAERFAEEGGSLIPFIPNEEE